MSNIPALVLVTTSFPISGDGSEAAGSFVSDLAEELAKHMPVRVVAPGKETACQAWADGVEVFRFATPGQPLSMLKPWRPRELNTIRRVLAGGEAATRQAVTAGPTQHILALWALPSGHWARKISREAGINYSVWTLGSDIWSLGRIPIVRSYLRRVLQGAHKCYSDGIKLAEDTRQIAGRDVEFLPSTRRINSKRIAPMKTEPSYRFLFLGRWHQNKGIDLLLEALHMLSEEDWKQIEAVEICGGGPMEGTVRENVDRLHMAGWPVELRGYLSKAEAEESIIRADWLLIPSRIESIPVVFSDTVKLSCPVLATPVGDLEYLVRKDKSGELATTASASAIAALIHEALSRSPADYQHALSSAAIGFDLERIADRLMMNTESGNGR